MYKITMNKNYTKKLYLSKPIGIYAYIIIIKNVENYLV